MKLATMKLSQVLEKWLYVECPRIIFGAWLLKWHAGRDITFATIMDVENQEEVMGIWVQESTAIAVVQLSGYYCHHKCVSANSYKKPDIRTLL